MSKRISGRRLAFIALLSLMAVIGLLTNVKPYAELLNEAERSKDLVSKALMFFNRSFSSERTVGVLLFAGILFAAYKVLGMEKDRRAFRCALVFSVFFGAVQTICKSYAQTDDWYPLAENAASVLRTLCIFIGYAFPAFLLARWLMSAPLLKTADRRELTGPGRPGIRTIRLAAVFFVCWLPYFILLYPGVSNWDVAAEIAQWFHIRIEFILNMSAVRGPEIYITNHHPFFDTVIFGSFVKAGLKLFGSAQAGVALYSVCQTAVMAILYAAVIVYLEDRKQAKILCLKVFVAAFPLFGVYSVSMLKDTLFALSVLFASFMLLRFADDREKAFRDLPACGLLVLSLILMSLTKNQGVYIAVITCLVLLLLFRKFRKQIAACVMITVVFYFGIWNGIVLPACHVAPGGKQEAIAFMFQQTALYVKEYPDEVTEHERMIINNLLPYDRLPDLYDPDIYDNVKDKYKQNATPAMRRAYYRVWFRMFLKHPECYFRALIRTCYGFFRIEQDNWLIYSKLDNAVGSDSPVYVTNSYPDKNVPGILVSAFFLFQRIPLVNLLFSVSFCNWLVIYAFFHMICRKTYAQIAVIMPALVSVGIYLVSPFNANARYVMPAIMLMPVLFEILAALCRKTPTPDPVNGNTAPEASVTENFG